MPVFAVLMLTVIQFYGKLKLGMNLHAIRYYSKYPRKQEGQDNMDKSIYKVTKPYIRESLAALAIDAFAGLFVYLFLAVLTKEYAGALLFDIPILLMALFMDIPLLIRCLRDRKNGTVIEELCSFVEIDCDPSFSNKWRLRRESPSSLLTTWYYPKEWHMERHRLVFKTKDGKSFKARCICSYGHGQGDFLTDLSGICRQFGDQMLFRVRYCKNSKALLSMSMIGYPPDMKKRTKDYIDSNLRDILRWTVKN